MMAKYRLKHVTHSAEQWQPGDAELSGRLGVVEYVRLGGKPAARLKADRGDYEVEPDDWIVTDPDGKVSVVSPKTFAAVYEPA